MPRLFPSLGRSSKEQARVYGQYDGYDAPYGQYGYGYEEQETQNGSAWRKVFPKKSTKRQNYHRQDEGTFSRTRGYRTTVEDYPEDNAPPRALAGPVLPTDDTQSFEELLAGRDHSDTSIPLVQRESSLARLQQAFADHGTYAPTMSAVPSGSHGAPFYAPQPAYAGKPHVSAVNDMHEPPVVVNPIAPREAVRPDIVHHSSTYPTREKPIHRRRERERSAPPVVKASRDHPAYWDKPLEPEEEPPVVVVVEHGKNGKKDKYYIIPSGAPVIFEDEDGNELTRVGDFSGRYRPLRRPRPVIVQDQYGREICRAGFNNDDQISVGSRSMDGYSYHSESGRSHHRGRSAYRTSAQHDSREHGSNHGSHHSSHHNSSHSNSRMYAPDSYLRDPHYQPSRGRAGTRSPHDDLYTDPRPPRSERSAGHSSSDTLVRSTSPRYDDQRGRTRTHGSRREQGSDDRAYAAAYHRDYRRQG
ncbi:hypothetical protein L226DRAFT_571345 [Lentinus tigrinus ALCF2SS1-7]|uniref:Uncharacterized protein n=1 Tax=Lentinus tigrinus ALCF2SS1-6 TaxID=1328759 RepID=A0A5C2SFL9_9APHY|nr:hypothetical protein L227DRAFT_573829 [Lentinus tigrinus ALCF2SS1-6]RPD74456.1 hypothetical protein L226DRAFT_571345 [Lentinus tigrinus ALCF2SS1-7]